MGIGRPRKDAKPLPIPENIHDDSDIPKGIRDASIGGKLITAKDLGLDIDAAERGAWGRFLPRGYYHHGKTYPLPTSRTDLFRIAQIEFHTCANVPPKQYVKRCKTRYKLYISKRSSMSLESKVFKAQKALSKIKESRTAANKEYKEFKETVSKDLAKCRASLTVLYDLAGSGFRKIMQEFVDEKTRTETHVSRGGQETTTQVDRVTNAEFTGAAKAVFSQVARLGTPSGEDAKEEAQDIIFQEALKEMGEKLKLGEGNSKTEELPAVKVKGPEGDQ